MQGGGHRFGHAAGPQWASLLPRAPTASQITLEYGVEVTSVQPSSGKQNIMISLHFKADQLVPLLPHVLAASQSVLVWK